MALTQYQRAALEELGVERVKHILAQEPGSSRSDIINLGKWLNDFRAKRQSWPWYKRLGYRIGVVR